MKSSLIRSGAAAIVAGLAFAACAGHGMVPSSGAPVSSDVIHAAPAATSPCPIPVGFPFKGSCNPIAIATTGATGDLKPYKGFTLTSALSTNNAKKGTYLVFQDATGEGDIGKYNGQSFPKLKGAILYLAALNTSKAFSFNATPSIKITSKAAIKGKSCLLNELMKTGWQSTPISGTVKGHSVTFGSLPVALAVPASTTGPFYLGFSCK
jgi:hypothetical protein